MKADEQRVRELAYQIWQSEGCPHGQDARHWQMACKLAEAESTAPAPKPAAGRVRKNAGKPLDVAPGKAGAAAVHAAASKVGAETAAGAAPATGTRKPRTPRATKKDT